MLLSKPNSKRHFATDQRERKNMDRLSRDACAALDAGMSYGQYKALHPHTPDEEEQPKPAPVPKGLVEKTCPWCGVVFGTKKNNQIYCSVRCQAANRRHTKSQRAKEVHNNG